MSQKLSTHDQRAVLLAMNQVIAAELLGLTTRGLQKASPPAPRNADGSYSGPALVQWALARNAPDDPLLAGDDGSQHLERYRAARASVAEIELGERQGRLVDIDALSAWWISEVATPIRRAIETLGNQHGQAAADLITAALSKAEAAVEQRRPADVPA